MKLRNSGNPHDDQILGIEILRCVSALMVLMLHFGTGLINEASLYYKACMSLGVDSCTAPARLPSIIFTGSLGVQFFFVISGLVVTASSFGCTNIKEFYVKRLIRLYPGLWICTILSASLLAMLSLAEPAELMARTARSIVLLPFGAHIDDVVWTLILEIIFYFYVGVAYFWAGNRGLQLCAQVLCLICLTYWGLYYVSNALSFATYFENRWVAKLTSVFIVQHGAFFAWGMILFIRNIRQENVPIWVTPACWIGMLLQIYWTGSYFADGYSEFGADTSGILELIVGLSGLFLIQLAVVHRQSVNRAVCALGIPARNAGLLTYPIYLLHGTIGLITMAALSKYFDTPVAILGAGLIVIVASAVVAHAWEPPAQRVLRRSLLSRLAKAN